MALSIRPKCRLYTPQTYMCAHESCGCLFHEAALWERNEIYLITAAAGTS